MLDFELINFFNIKLNFLFFFDFYSLIFLASVLLISFRVFIFRRRYIHLDKYFIRFHYLLLSFVISIIFLIISPNMIRVLLGWDGLGVRSYLLVIYYASPKSYNAGIITFLSNRIGDALIIVSLGYYMYIRTLNLNRFRYELNSFYFWVVVIVILAACTKRAQIPFRA